MKVKTVILAAAMLLPAGLKKSLSKRY